MKCIQKEENQYENLMKLETTSWKKTQKDITFLFLLTRITVTPRSLDTQKTMSSRHSPIQMPRNQEFHLPQSSKPKWPANPINGKRENPSRNPPLPHLPRLWLHLDRNLDQSHLVSSHKKKVATFFLGNTCFLNIKQCDKSSSRRNDPYHTVWKNICMKYHEICIKIYFYHSIYIFIFQKISSVFQLCSLHDFFPSKTWRRGAITVDLEVAGTLQDLHLGKLPRFNGSWLPGMEVPNNVNG